MELGSRGSNGQARLNHAEPAIPYVSLYNYLTCIMALSLQCPSRTLRIFYVLTLFIPMLFVPSRVVAQSPDASCRWHSFTTANGLAGNIVQALWEDPQGRIWFGTENGVSRYDGHSWITYRAEDGLLNNNVWSISGSAESVWFGTSSGLSVLRNGQWRSYTTRDGLPSNDVRAVLVDRDGTVWVGTFGQGVGRKEPGNSRWEPFVPAQRLRGQLAFVQSIWQASAGPIWFSTNSFGAVRLDGEAAERFNFRLGSRNTVWSVGAERQNDITWLATFRGIVRVAEDDSVSIVDDIVEGVVISDTEVLAVAGGQAHDLWFGTRAHGVFHLTDGAWEHFTTRNGLSSNYVQTILVDRSERVWFGTRGGGVTLCDRYPLLREGLQPAVVGHDIEDNTTIALENAVLDHDQNNLRFTFTARARWVPGQEIAFRYWLEHDESGKTTRPQTVVGDPTYPITARSEPFVNLDPGTYILHVIPYLGEIEGAEHRYAFMIRSAPPLLAADALTVMADGHVVEHGLTLPQVLFGSHRRVHLTFVADDDVTARADLQYQYRIDSLDSGWQQADDATTVITLPRGQHTVAVRAIDAAGNYSAPMTRMIIVPPPLWTTLLFYLLLILIPSILSGAVGALGYRRWTRRQALRRAISGYLIPYDVGPLITVPDRYIGRRHVLDTVMGKIANNSFYIYGEKRIGKTSLLLQLKQRLVQRSALEFPDMYIPVFRNIQDVPQSQFWLYLIRSIAAEVAHPLETLAAHTGFETGYDDLEAESDLESIMEHLRISVAPRRPCIVLLIDEVDTLQRYDLGIRQRFRAFCQHMQRHVRVVLAGVLPPRAEVSDTSPWYNIFERIALGPLPPSDALHLIRNYNHNPYTYTPEAEQAILQAGDGKPFDTQWLCSEAVKAMLAVKRTRVILADVEQAIRAILRERDGEYAALWRQVPGVLHADIRATIRRQSCIMPAPDVRSAYDQLLEMGLALKTAEGYRLATLFRHWLQERV